MVSQLVAAVAAQQKTVVFRLQMVLLWKHSPRHQAICLKPLWHLSTPFLPSGNLSLDALAKAKKALQKQKELSEKLKKLPL
uniref:Uncharacterized protein n=1 Tax=Salix viminalis TaxID=40686 RepID=A0A6N2NDP3_SALVM